MIISVTRMEMGQGLARKVESRMGDFVVKRNNNILVYRWKQPKRYE